MSRLALITAALVACNTDATIDSTETIDTSFCDSFTCFDSDPCTDDLCQPDGSCLHVARNAFLACQTNAHCDDSNPCTDDTCSVDECGLDRCVNTWRTGCQQCNPEFGLICDDSNPCTDDRCGDDDMCDFVANSPHCDVDCRQALATSAEAAQWGGYQGFVAYFFGVAEPKGGINCDAGLCSCDAPLQLAAYGFGFPIRAPGAAADAWSCSLEACELREATCSPMIEGVGYVAWGYMQYQSQFEQQGRVPQADTFLPADAGASDQAAPPNLTIDRFDAQGYCLSTRFEHLPGPYAGKLSADGKVATFEVEMTAGTFGEVTAMMSECDGCEALGLRDLQTLPIGPEFGVVQLDLAGINGNLRSRLFARTDRFIGDLVEEDGTFVGVLELERLPR